MKPGLRYALLGAAVVLLLLLAWAVVWLLRTDTKGKHVAIGGRMAVGSNPALNLRFKYNAAVFTLAPFNSRAEFPLRLDAVGNGGSFSFSFYGKRLGGLGQMLAKAPGPVLYDFTGQLSDSMFVESYGLEPAHDPRYEDAEIAGRLALHQVLQFKRGAARAWPGYFPDAVKLADVVYIEGWTLITENDLFFFYAMSPQPLSDSERAACEQVLNSLQFNAIQAAPAAAPPASEAQPAQDDATTGEPEPPQQAAPETQPEAGSDSAPPPETP
jgi:hypothetical protein